MEKEPAWACSALRDAAKISATAGANAAVLAAPARTSRRVSAAGAPAPDAASAALSKSSMIFTQWFVAHFERSRRHTADPSGRLYGCWRCFSSPPTQSALPKTE